MVALPPQPAPWPDQIYDRVSTNVGLACSGLLLLEDLWVHRRVETIDILSTQFVRRSVSVDFTVPEVARDLLRLEESGDSLVPLATLRKRPLRNFSLRNESGAAVPVVGRRHDGPIANAIVETAARHALEAANLTGPSSSLGTGLATVATGDPEEAEDAVNRIVAAANAEDPECRALLDHDPARFLIADLMDNYVLLAVLEDVERRRIMKFSYEEPFEVARPRLVERLTWRPLLVELETPAIGRAASYHAEVSIPEELRIDRTLLLDRDSGDLYAVDGEADRAAIHAYDVPRDAPGVLLFGILPERTAFPVVGFFIAWITGLLLLTGGLFVELDPTAAGPPVSILLAALAVFAGVVARAGEHRLVQALFAGPRLLLVVNAGSALAAAASLAFGASDSTIDGVWTASAAVSGVVAVILTVSLISARPIVSSQQ